MVGSFRVGRVWLVLVGVVGVVVAGCGSSGSSGTSGASGSSSTASSSTSGSSASGSRGVDVGTGKPIALSVKDMKIAFIASGMQTPLGVAQKKGVEEVAKKYGVPVTTFDGRLDVARQFSLYQTVVGGGKYNVIITLPMGGQQDCDVLSKQAPAKGIVVSVMTIPICGKEFASALGDGLWAPGTLNTVGYNSNANGYASYAKTCAKVTGGGKLVLLNGVAGTPNNRAMTKAYQASGMDIVANYATDYTPETANKDISAALRSHPDVKVIATTFPALTLGAIQAIKSAHKKPGTDIKLCNYTGGGKQMLDLIKAGVLSADAYTNSEWVAKAATQQVFDAVAGKPVLRYSEPGPDGTPTKSTGQWPPAVTKDNVNQYQPTGE
jgi:ribose transport system substrate-binding protein